MSLIPLPSLPTTEPVYRLTPDNTVALFKRLTDTVQQNIEIWRCGGATRAEITGNLRAVRREKTRLTSCIVDHMTALYAYRGHNYYGEWRKALYEIEALANSIIYPEKTAV